MAFTAVISCAVLCLLVVTASADDGSSPADVWNAIAGVGQASKQSGQGTFYCTAGFETASVNGACGLNSGSAGINVVNGANPAWTKGTRIAINMQQFAGSLTCGMCIKFRNTGVCLTPDQNGYCGQDPPPPVWYDGFVDDACPECGWGGIDLCDDGHGKWAIEWYAVPCDADGDGHLQYRNTATSNSYFELAVANYKAPISSISVTTPDGATYGLARAQNNRFQYYGSPNFPMQLQITSVTGEVIYDSLNLDPNSAQDQVITGAAQFTQFWNFPAQEIGWKNTTNSSGDQSQPQPNPDDSGAVTEQSGTVNAPGGRRMLKA